MIVNDVWVKMGQNFVIIIEDILLFPSVEMYTISTFH